MPLLSLLQASLTGGELSPTMSARVDLPRYQNSLALCRNFIVRHWGGVDNRPGTGYIGAVKNSANPARLIPFIFNNGQSYVLEFGAGYIRFITNGAYILSGGVPYEVVTFFVASELAAIKFTQSADVLTVTHPIHQTAQLSRFSDTNWTYTQITNAVRQNAGTPFQPPNTNTSITVYASATTGAITLNSVGGGLFDTGHVGANFRLNEVDLSGITPWEPGKLIVTGTNSPNGLLRRSNGNVYKCVTTGNPGAGNSWCTGTTPPTWTSGTESDGDGNPATVAGVAFTKSGMAWAYLHSQYGVCTITAYTSPTQVSASVLGYMPDSVVGSGNAVWDWQDGSWSSDAGYPSCTAYVGDRLCVAGTVAEPQTLWMSGVSNYSFFGESNPIVDSDSIDITVNSRKINTICDMVPLANLLLLTAGGEFALFGDQSGLIAPSTANVKGQSYYGCSPNVRALGVGNSAVFVQARGYIVRDLTYSLQQDAYIGDDLTLYANHLALGFSFVDMDYSQLPYSCIWLVRSDGVLCSMTYVKEQGILGWARHDTINGAFENVCVVPEGNEDVAYFVVRRVINGATVRYVERMATRQVTDQKYNVFLDASLSFDGTNTNAGRTMTLTGGINWNQEENLILTAAGYSPFTAGNVGGNVSLTGADGSTVRVNVLAVTSSTVATVRPLADIPPSLQGISTAVYGIGFLKFGGLTHLIGQTVGVFGDGGVQAQVVVDGTGSITLETPAVVVCAGLPIQAQLQTLEITYPYGETVSGKSLRGVYKSIPRVNILLNESRGFKVGTKFTDLYETKFRWQEGMGEETQLFTGVMEQQTDTANDNSAVICIQVDDPVPVSVLGIIPEVAAGQ